MTRLTLSKEQTLAATSPKSHLIIIAPPGCGKTEILAHRAAHLIPTLAKNQRLLALTFTNRAQTNLKERLRTVLGQTRMRRYITVRNFHGLATEIVLSHGKTIGLNVEILRLPKTTTLRNALSAVGGKGTQIYGAEDLLKRIKRNPLSDEEVLAALRQEPASPARDLAEAAELYRQESNQLHYEDLLRYSQRLLQIPAVARLYQAHFGAVLVDEFQDLSLQQLDLARLSCTSNQTFAGDPLQGIYTWAGAMPTRVMNEISTICGDPIRLHESYRSTPQVLNTVNSISEQLDSESRLIAAQPEAWQDEGTAAKLELGNQANEASVIQRLCGIIMQSNPESSIGIISRAAWRRKEIDQAFSAETGFTVRRWDLAIDDPTIAGLLQSTIGTLPRGTTVEEARYAVLDKVDAADVDTLELIDQAFDTLEDSAATTAQAAIRSIRISDPEQTVGPGVHLLNAHTGKGQQFDWVFVVGLEEGHLPGRRNSQGPLLEEELRVLLVMLSRARQGLVVTKVQTREGLYGPYRPEASRWWSHLAVNFNTLEQLEAYLELI